MMGWMKNIVAAVLVIGLTACASQPPGVVALAVDPRVARLTELGFEKIEEGYALNLRGPLLFETGSDQLLEPAREKIERLSVELKKLDIKKLRLFGHTDNVGTPDFNMTLSRKRAESVAQAFIASGFAEPDLERRGFGMERPVASNDTAEGRSQNRRVAIIVPFFD